MTRGKATSPTLPFGAPPHLISLSLTHWLYRPRGVSAISLSAFLMSTHNPLYPNWHGPTQTRLSFLPRNNFDRGFKIFFDRGLKFVL